jgi:hypothetical protein
MPQMTIDQAFRLAFAHQAAGRLREAEALYRQILAVRPGSATTTRQQWNGSKKR